MTRSSRVTGSRRRRGSERRDELLVLGSGGRFLSGISYHTAAIIRSFERAGVPVSGILVDRLCPKWMYPGRRHVGDYDNAALGIGDAPVFARLDWYLLPSVIFAIRFLRIRRPRVVLVQWWTFATAPAFVLLAAAARVTGAKVVLEAHEVNDPSEARLPGIAALSRGAIRLVAGWSSAVVVHSNHDAKAMVEAFPSIATLPSRVVVPGPLEHGQRSATESRRERKTAAGGPCRFLFFGLLREYKGLDDLASAFAQLVADGHEVFLEVVGEPWDEVGAALARLEALGPDRVRVRRGFLPDSEVEGLYASVDVFVAPYHRGSASGPLNLALGYGVPIVVTEVPALVEACEGFGGLETARIADPASLAAAMLRARGHIGKTLQGKTSWDRNVGIYQDLFSEIS